MYLEHTDTEAASQWFALHQLDAGHLTMLLKVCHDAKQRIGLLDKTDQVRLQQLVYVLERDIENVCKPKTNHHGSNFGN